MKFLKFYTVALSCFLIGSCVYGPKAERKTPLSYLDGENYATTVEGYSDVLAVPLAIRKEKATQIDGKVLLGEGIAGVPIKNQKVALYSPEGKLLSEVTSGNAGEFRIKSAIRNGSYVLKVVSDSYSGEVPITIKDYTLENVVLKVSANP
jgi:hypothetical protein